MSIPIIIINRDRLSTTERLIDQFLLLGYEDITILDMDSTYPALLEFYDKRSSDFTVMYWENTGHKALWQDDILKEHFNQYSWVCITDSDIELNLDTPKGFLEEMIYIAEEYRIDKIGAAIRYKGITNSYLRSIIEPIESMYWNRKIGCMNHTLYDAPIDTTLCVVRPELPFQYKAIRVADWSIRHIPWLEDWDNLTEEQEYYHNHADITIATGTQHLRNYQNSK